MLSGDGQVPGSFTTGKGAIRMSKTTPWHSTRPDDNKVHHDETRCTEGNNIEDRYRESGTGGYPKCARCREISG
jgi:hypothetical protein